MGSKSWDLRSAWHCLQPPANSLRWGAARLTLLPGCSWFPCRTELALHVWHCGQWDGGGAGERGGEAAGNPERSRRLFSGVAPCCMAIAHILQGHVLSRSPIPVCCLRVCVCVSITWTLPLPFTHYVLPPMSFFHQSAPAKFCVSAPSLTLSLPPSPSPYLPHLPSHFPFPSYSPPRPFASG